MLGSRRIAVDRRQGRGPRHLARGAQDQEVAAADALCTPGGVLDQELAVHDRNAPVAPAGQPLAALEAVAEVAQRPAHGGRGVAVQARRSRRCRRRSARTGRPAPRAAWPGPCSPIANSSTAIPGRPSGVSSGASSRSMPASQPQAITEVAKPVIASAAVRAQRGSSAVISSRVARIGNASANVSSIMTPLRITAIASSQRTAWADGVQRTRVLGNRRRPPDPSVR